MLSHRNVFSFLGVPLHILASQRPRRGKIFRATPLFYEGNNNHSSACQIIVACLIELRVHCKVCFLVKLILFQRPPSVWELQHATKWIDLNKIIVSSHLPAIRRRSAPAFKQSKLHD